jgi:hypothetical protein
MTDPISFSLDEAEELLEILHRAGDVAQPASVRDGLDYMSGMLEAKIQRHVRGWWLTYGRPLCCAGAFCALAALVIIGVVCLGTP